MCNKYKITDEEKQGILQSLRDRIGIPGVNILRLLENNQIKIMCINNEGSFGRVHQPRFKYGNIIALAEFEPREGKQEPRVGDIISLGSVYIHEDHIYIIKKLGVGSIEMSKKVINKENYIQFNYIGTSLYDIPTYFTFFDKEKPDIYEIGEQ
jgi:hypothetical protein